MTVAAGGMAYVTLQTYQEQVSVSTETGTEHVSSLGKTQVKVEEASDGKFYVRNLGSEPLRKISILVEGRPIDVTGPEECESGKVCVFEMSGAINCPTGSCSVKVETATGSSLAITVAEEEIELILPPQYSGWNLNTTNLLFGEAFLANVTWESGSPACSLVGGCYWFSNQTLVAEEVGELEWGR